MEIKKEGIFPAHVLDARTGMDLTCIMEYGMSVEYIVMQEERYKGFTREKSLEEQINPDGIVAVAVYKVYPDGIPFEAVDLLAPKLEKAAEEQINLLYMGAGVLFRRFRITSLDLKASDRKKLTDAAEALGLPAVPEAPKQPEPAQQAPWTCYCGNVCFSNFCPQCGSKKPRV